MINTKQAARLRYLVHDLVVSSRADEMKGAGDPDDRAQIEAELIHAHRALQTHISSITQPKATVAVPTNIAQAQAMRVVAIDYMRRHKK